MERSHEASAQLMGKEKDLFFTKKSADQATAWEKTWFSGSLWPPMSSQ